MKMYLEVINGQEVYLSEGKWIVEDEYGWAAYDTREDAVEAAEEGQYTIDYLEDTGNMPCDNTGFCAGSSCSQYYQCQG